MADQPSLIGKLVSSAAHATGDARGRIVSSAVDQIGDFGVRRFTVDELARRVGLSRVTIYRHFQSKDEVLEAAVLHELNVLMTEVNAVAARCETAEERVVESFVFTVRHFRDHAAFQRLLRTEPETILPLLTTRGDVVLATGRELIVSLARGEETKSELSQAQLEILAEMVSRLIVSLVLTPESVMAVDSEAELRIFAGRYVGGIMRSFSSRVAG